MIISVEVGSSFVAERALREEKTTSLDDQTKGKLLDTLIVTKLGKYCILL